MSRQSRRGACTSIALSLALIAMPALAGEADFEPADIHEHGNPYFGEVKDIKGLAPSRTRGSRCRSRHDAFLHRADRRGGALSPEWARPRRGSREGRVLL